MKGTAHSSLILLNAKIFNIETFKEVVSYFENTEVNETEDSLGDVTRVEDIYKDDWRELVEEAIETIDETKKLYSRRRLIKFNKDINIPYVLNQALKMKRIAICSY